MIIKFKKGLTAPTGLTLAEPAFNYTQNKFYIGMSGGTGLWVGAEIKTSMSYTTDPDDSFTIPTQGAVKNYIDNYVVSGGSTYDIQEFETSGIWTKPSNAKICYVWGCGGGGAGTNGGNTASGNGGGGGLAMMYILDPTIIGQTLSITIGAGGLPAIGHTASNWPISFGKESIITGLSLSSPIYFPGGGAGYFTNTSTRGALSPLGYGVFQSYFQSGGTRFPFGTNTVANTNSKLGAHGGFGPAGGGAGGGSGAGLYDGGSGGTPLFFSQTGFNSNCGGGASGGPTYSSNGFNAIRTVFGFGEGAGGGAFGKTMNGGRGGAGYRGSGGGGGGIGTTGFEGGSGGTGGDGYIKIITICA